jgi:hypothetical protein
MTLQEITDLIDKVAAMTGGAPTQPARQAAADVPVLPVEITFDPDDSSKIPLDQMVI